MNPLTRAAADGVLDAGPSALVTVLFVVLFLGWVGWTWLPRTRANLDAWARAPLSDDTPGGDA
jgi:hypothetical protein